MPLQIFVSTNGAIFILISVFFSVVSHAAMDERISILHGVPHTEGKWKRGGDLAALHRMIQSHRQVGFFNN